MAEFILLNIRLVCNAKLDSMELILTPLAWVERTRVAQGITMTSSLEYLCC